MLLSLRREMRKSQLAEKAALPPDTSGTEAEEEEKRGCVSMYLSF